MTLRVAIYARYSTDAQNAASIEDQFRLCRERAAREGWQIVGSYEDGALSGFSMIQRQGVQRLLDDGRAGRFDLVLSEALDRLSRNQADIASLYQSLTFAGVGIVTIAEGRVDEMHIGLKGTMNALFLKDLAAKTHRGLRGRVEKGKSGGGNAYGYRVLRSYDGDGEPIRGDREIDADEARIVQRIFRSYAEGQSPNKIADMLNQEGLPGPRGSAWDKSTIHGNPKRGIGILNNELYIGKLVWNRQRFVKDPATGRRQARPNPPGEWIVKDVPDLRIIDEALWHNVKARQAGRRIEHTDTEAWQKRKPKFLLTGLVKCGCCSGGFSTVAKDRFGCSNARNKGGTYCGNRTTISREELEGRILAALTHRLMDPELVKVFAAEYIAERNRLAASQGDDRQAIEKELARVIKDQDVLVSAILAGTPAERIKARMEQLERRQKQLEADLARSSSHPAPVLIHPGLAGNWQARIGDLVHALGAEKGEGPARDAIRGLIEKVVVSPVPTGGKRMAPQVMLYGALAGILRLCLGADRMSGQQKTSCEQEVAQSVEFLVAGAGFEPAAFRL